VTTSLEGAELMQRAELAVRAREYLNLLTARTVRPAIGRDQVEHLKAFGHLPAKGCCAPPLAAVKGD